MGEGNTRTVGRERRRRGANQDHECGPLRRRRADRGMGVNVKEMKGVSTTSASNVLSDVYQADTSETAAQQQSSGTECDSDGRIRGSKSFSLCVSSVARVQMLRVVPMGSGFGMGGISW